MRPAREAATTGGGGGIEPGGRLAGTGMDGRTLTGVADARGGTLRFVDGELLSPLELAGNGLREAGFADAGGGAEIRGGP